MRNRFLLTVIIAISSVIQTYAGVYDFAGIIGSIQEYKMDSQLVSYERRTNVRLTIITTSSEKYYVAVAEKAKRNEILIFIIPDKKMCIANVGEGLKQWVTESYASLILRQNIYPAFENQRYDDGLKKIISELYGKIGEISQYERETILLKGAIESERNRTAFFRILFCIMGVCALALSIYFPLKRKRLLSKISKEKSKKVFEDKCAPEIISSSAPQELVRQDD